MRNHFRTLHKLKNKMMLKPRHLVEPLILQPVSLPPAREEVEGSSNSSDMQAVQFEGGEGYESPHFIELDDVDVNKEEAEDFD